MPGQGWKTTANVVFFAFSSKDKEFIFIFES